MAAKEVLGEEKSVPTIAGIARERFTEVIGNDVLALNKLALGTRLEKIQGRLETAGLDKKAYLLLLTTEYQQLQGEYRKAAKQLRLSKESGKAEAIVISEVLVALLFVVLAFSEVTQIIPPEGSEFTRATLVFLPFVLAALELVRRVHEMPSEKAVTALRKNVSYLDAKVQELEASLGIEPTNVT